MNKHFQKLVDRYPDLEFILYTENDLLDGLDLIEFGKEYKEIESYNHLWNDFLDKIEKQYNK